MKIQQLHMIALDRFGNSATINDIQSFLGEYGFRLAKASITVTMASLTEKGFASSRLRRSIDVLNVEREMRFFTMTKNGRAALRESIEDIQISLEMHRSPMR